MSLFLIALKVIFALLIGVVVCVTVLVTAYIISWALLIHYSNRKSKKDKTTKET